jgi:hypothetical protein
MFQYRILPFRKKGLAYECDRGLKYQQTANNSGIEMPAIFVSRVLVFLSQCFSGWKPFLQKYSDGLQFQDC